MTRKSILIPAACGALVFSVAARGQSLAGPTLGFVFDPAVRGIRPIWGVPGDATLGQPIGAGIALARAAVCSRGGYALAEPAGGNGVVLLLLAAGGQPGRPIPGLLPGADTIAFSPSGDSALFFHRAAGTLQILTGLPQAPRLGGEIATATLPSPVTALAVSDGGASILAGVSDGRAGSVLRLTADGRAIPVFSAEMPAAIGFLGGRDDALIADSAANTVSLLQSVSGTPRASTVAGPLVGIAQPVAVQASLDNRLAVVANTAPAGIVTLNLATGAAQVVACDCKPTGLSRLKGAAVFAVSGMSGGSMAAFDGDHPQPRILFMTAAEPRRRVQRYKPD